MKKTTAIIVSCVLLFVGCSSESESEQEDEVVLGKIELTEAWARPASSGQTSGVYLTIANGTAEADTLLSVSSEAASKVEIHESYEENGVSGMRPAGQQIIKPAEELQFKPGGLHIMLTDLNRNLSVEDSVSVSLDFARVGTKNLRVPVKIQR